MKGRLTTLLGSVGALALLTSPALAHPGHAATDVTAQLAAPLAGADHAAVFAIVSGLALLGAARLALYLSDRRRRMATVPRSRR
jgi:hypothetical protein